MTERTRTFYLVGSNMPGYLPDSDPYIVRTKRSAIQASREDAQRHYDDERGEGYRIRLTGARGDYWVEPEEGATIHYWVHPVVGTLTPAPEHCRCDACGMRIPPGELSWEIEEGYIHSAC